MLTKIENKIVDEEISKIYVINSKRKDKNGDEYIYKNYQTFLPYSYVELMGIEDCIYFYYHDNKIYMTSEQPDGSVPSKKISLHKQRGSKRSRTFKPEETKNNKWARFFIIPKMFFPMVSEDKKVRLILNPNEKDLFSNAEATLTMELI